MVYSPESISHQTSDKTVQISNSLLVGRSLNFNCFSDIKPSNLNFRAATNIRSFAAGSSGDGMVGLAWSNFMSNSNGAPNFAWLFKKN